MPEKENEQCSIKDILLEIVSRIRRIEIRLDSIESELKPKSKNYVYDGVVQWLKTVDSKNQEKEKSSPSD